LKGWLSISIMRAWPEWTSNTTQSPFTNWTERQAYASLIKLIGDLRIDFTFRTIRKLLCDFHYSALAWACKGRNYYIYHLWLILHDDFCWDFSELLTYFHTLFVKLDVYRNTDGKPLLVFSSVCESVLLIYCVQLPCLSSPFLQRALAFRFSIYFLSYRQVLTNFKFLRIFSSHK